MEASQAYNSVVFLSWPPRKNKVWSPDQNNVRTINKEDCHFQLLMGFITNFGGFTLEYSKLKRKWKDENFAHSATVPHAALLPSEITDYCNVEKQMKKCRIVDGICNYVNM